MTDADLYWMSCSILAHACWRIVRTWTSAIEAAKGPYSGETRPLRSELYQVMYAVVAEALLLN